MDIESIKIVKLCKASQKTTDKIIKNIRILIAKECEKISKMQGEIEIDESYFGAKRVRGKRGRGAGKKTMCFCFASLATVSRRYVKAKWTSLYANSKELFY